MSGYAEEELEFQLLSEDTQNAREAKEDLAQEGTARRWQLLLLLLLFLTLGTYNPEGDEKLKIKYKIRYDHQSVIIIIVNDKGPKPLTCQNKNNSKIHS